MYITVNKQDQVWGSRTKPWLFLLFNC